MWKKYHLLIPLLISKLLLTDIKNLENIFQYVENISIHKDLINISKDIFKDYYDFLSHMNKMKYVRKLSQKEISLEVTRYVETRNLKYDINLFKGRFTDLINADKFFNDVVMKSFKTDFNN